MNMSNDKRKPLDPRCEEFNVHPRRGISGERGAALFMAAFLAVVVIGLSYSTIFVSVTEVQRARLEADKMRAYYAAEAGVELGIDVLKRYTRRSSIDRALSALDGLFVDDGGNAAINRVYVDHELVHSGRSYGTVNVQFSLADAGVDHRYITITVDAYVPGRYATVNGRQVERYKAHSRLEKTMRVQRRPGEVFDYSYFINNWGWFYGDSIVANGNARSNGQFDAGGYRPTINGVPRYDKLVITEDPVTHAVKADLQGYVDDNNDGVRDGSDGGIYSGWNIVGGDRVRGMASRDENKHAFVHTVPMPNLNEMSHYELLARTREIDGQVVPSSIRVGSTLIDAVFGDDPQEPGNLYLHGTDTDPIVIDGPVVVRGHLIIHGKVTGQGSLYVQGNVYIPSNLEYVDPPKDWTPKSNSEADTEQWIAENYKKDFLGIFAKENIVIGDYTEANWRYYVSWWLSHPLNKSREDSGVDQIPNTRNGRDGIPNTADDDLLEDDNVWTVERYTLDDYRAGIVPMSKVGTPIPGTGEDIDGDGRFDDTIGLADFDIRPNDRGEYGGNVLDDNGNGIKQYDRIASTKVSRIDGILYTNHALAVRTTRELTFNGSITSRNEAIIYGNNFTANYDRRMLGGGDNPNVVLPKVFAPITEDGQLETDLLGPGGGSRVPLVPNREKRLAADPTDTQVGLVMKPVAICGS